MSFEDQQVVVVQRYDRLLQPDGSFLRLHQEDLCQALGIPPERKYQAENGPTSANVVELLRAQVTGRASEHDVGRFTDALIFNWVIGGTDAHAKNYSLLLSGRQIRLAPLYDVGSALPYPNLHIRKLRLAMKFGGSYTLLSRDHAMWAKVASELGLPKDSLVDRARKLIDRVADAFSQAAAEPGVRALESPLPAMLIDAVAARAAQCRETLH
jgi:serine/threonine-protein kinase HipA